MAASRACSTSTTWTGRQPPRQDPAHPGGRSRLAPGRFRVLLHPLSRAERRAAAAKSTITARCSSTALGGDPADDPLVFQPTEKEYWPGVGISPTAGGCSSASRAPSTRPTSTWAIATRRLDPAPPWCRSRRTCPLSFEGEVVRGRLYLRTNLDAPTYRLYEVDPAASRARASWRELVPPRPGRGARGRPGRGDRLVLSYLEHASSRLRLADLDGGLRHELALPTLGSLFGLGVEPDGHELFFGFSSYTVPPSVYRVDLAADRQAALAAGRGRCRPGPVRGAARSACPPPTGPRSPCSWCTSAGSSGTGTRRPISPATVGSTSA